MAILSQKYQSAITKIEKFDKLMAYGRELENNCPEEVSTTALLQELILDPSCPTITIKRAQMNHVNSLSKYSEAVRYLMDCLFEDSIYRGLCYSVLKSNFPERVSAIEKFIESKFQLTGKTSISKIITNKCHGR